MKTEGERVRGLVSSWNEDDGWGVIESDSTPGGCWAHFSVIDTSGYAELEPGGPVDFEFEAAWQDGFNYRATWVASHDSPAG